MRSIDFLLILLILALGESMSIATTAYSVNNIFQGPKVRVDIFNKLPGNGSFSIHCKSKDDDLGTHEVGPGQKYGFDFRVNFWGTTLFFCGASHQGKQAEFVIYKASRDSEDRCPYYCIWEAREDAVVGFPAKNPMFDISVPWK